MRRLRLIRRKSLGCGNFATQLFVSLLQRVHAHAR